MKPWLFLLVAILAEVLGTSLMKLAVGQAPTTGYLAMYALIALSCYCLARAVERIPLGVAYALWGGAGAVVTSIAGAVLFGQRLDKIGVLGLLVLLSGMLLLKFG